ncbi:isochorismate synthase [Chroococcidiopsidales cyanobacterium LEGE 13417]|nr:isochorismate synthase [Chroococcidiopsidales cyanobacterium LEGE 13417]
MLLLPRPANYHLNCQKLYQFLVASQKNCDRNCSHIVSISLEIDLIDPLTVLEKLARSHQLNLYFENKSKGEAIAAIDAVAQLQLAGANRFHLTQKFIRSCLKETDIFDSSNHTFAKPHFFCSFSFFSEATADYPFPVATVFLPRWQIARQGDRCVLVANLPIEADTNIDVFIQQLWRKIHEITSIEQPENEGNHFQREFSQVDVSSIDRFKQAVIDCSELIYEQQLSKVVLAHAIDVQANTNFNLFKCLNRLRQMHPDCYVFSTHNGKGQNFIGASPERLISIRDRQLFTDALAGSISRGKTTAEDTVLANQLLQSEKERHEHRVVIDFITQSLQELGIAARLLSPRLRRLANIQHLWTPIQAKVPIDVHPLEIVAALHPTPAVGGVSRQLACKKIRTYEKFERGLYAAPLGWVNHQGDSEFIVGIRSALIDGDRARLYAGAGIVAGSNPDREIAEVRLKLQALLKALI